MARLESLALRLVQAWKPATRMKVLALQRKLALGMLATTLLLVPMSTMLMVPPSQCKKEAEDMMECL
jgi:hypothetical protein